MIQSLSKQISENMAASGAISSKDKNVCSYGMELILSAAASVLGIFIISLLFSNFYAWVMFLLAFIPLRITAGGYHAKTHLGCFTVFCAVFLACMFALENMNRQSLIIFCPIASLFSIFMMYLLSPVEASNKPLDAELKKKNRKKSLLIGLFNFVIAVLVFFFLEKYAKIAASYYFGAISAAISLTAAKIFQKGERKNEDNV